MSKESTKKEESLIAPSIIPEFTERDIDTLKVLVSSHISSNYSSREEVISVIAFEKNILEKINKIVKLKESIQ